MSLSELIILGNYKYDLAHENRSQKFYHIRRELKKVVSY